MRRRLPRDGYLADGTDDLVALVVLVVVSAFVLLAPVVSDTPIRYLFGVPFLLVFPGYALVSALFPGVRVEPGADAVDERTDDGLFVAHDLDGFERLALSVATSIVLVATVMFVLDQSGAGVGTPQAVGSIGLVTLALSTVGIVRTRRLPEAERFSVPFRRYVSGAREELVDPATNVDYALNVVLIACVGLAALGIAYGVTASPQSSGDTEFHLLTENETGALLAEGYPSSAAGFADTPVIVGIENQEGETTNYTLVVLRQQVEGDGNASTVVDQRELTRYSQSVPDGSELTYRHQPSPDEVDGASRIAYLLYRGSPPEDPNASNAYRDLYLWLDGDDESLATSESESHVREPLVRSTSSHGSWNRGDRVVADEPRRQVALST